MGNIIGTQHLFVLMFLCLKNESPLSFFGRAAPAPTAGMTMSMLDASLRSSMTNDLISIKEIFLEIQTAFEFNPSHCKDFLHSV